MLPGADFLDVGTLKRVEAAEMVVGYRFDLRTNKLTPRKVRNPGAGREHLFRAWRLTGASTTQVAMRDIDTADLEPDVNKEELDD